MSDDTYYIKGPTYEDQLREKHKPGYNPRFVTTRRYQLAKPLLKLWEWALGKEVAGSVGKALLVGHKVLNHSIVSYARPNTHPQDRETYEEIIERLKKHLSEQGEACARANEAAIRGENLARALRAVDGLIDDRNNAVRHQRKDTA